MFLFIRELQLWHKIKLIPQNSFEILLTDKTQPTDKCDGYSTLLMENFLAAYQSDGTAKVWKIFLSVAVESDLNRSLTGEP